MINRDEADDPWREEPGQPPEPVVEALERLASIRGWSRRLDGARVHGVWREIAGERLAQHTEPLRLHGGVLVVRATSSAWAAQIPFLANEIMTRANAVLGEGHVQRVVVARGIPPP